MPGHNHPLWCTCGWCFKIPSSSNSHSPSCRCKSCLNAASLFINVDHYEKYYSRTCFLTPCPAGCGASVFYCEPPRGGRVFFDPPLGKPWLLHPCTSQNKVSNSKPMPFCQKIEEREQYLVFDDGVIIWIAIPIKIQQNPDGTSQSINFRKMDGKEMTLYFYENSVVRKDFYYDINNNCSSSTNCFVTKHPDNLYYEIVFSIRGLDGCRPKDRDMQKLIGYETPNFPRKVSSGKNAR